METQIPDTVPVEAQPLFRAVLTSHLRDGRSELTAFVKAYRALEEQGYESNDGGWVRKDVATVGDVHVDAPLSGKKSKRKDDPGGDLETEAFLDNTTEELEKQDKVTLDVPLLIRLLEIAREEIKSDVPIHVLTERLVALSQSGVTLNMDDYDSIVSTIKGVMTEDKEADGPVKKYLPPVEVHNAAQRAADLLSVVPPLTATLAGGEGLAEGDVRKVADHFADADIVDESDLDRDSFGGRHAAKWAGRILRKIDVEKRKQYAPWHAIDFDGTLAEHTGTKELGAPVAAMIDRVKGWLDKGETVKVFTARVADDPGGEQAKAIADWIEKYIGTRLEVTCEKDPGMIDLWDDKAVGVERDIGEPKEEQTEKFDPEEDRDENGRWTSGGGGSDAAKEPIAFKPSEKMLRAIASRVPCGVREQRVADEQERKVSTALGIPRTKDNSAFDLNNGKVAVEIKCVQSSANGKITMSKAAIERKTSEAKRDKLKTYTVVADKRAGGTKYYISKGVGSFRVSAMTPTTLAEMRGVLR